MRRLKAIGLCVVAALALSAVAAAGAAAQEPPEIGRCVKVAAKTGQFTTNTCEKKAKPTKLGEYEFEAGAIKTGFKGHGVGAATLETVHKVKVSCTTEASSGKFTSAKTVGSVHVTFTGCVGPEKYECSSVSAAKGEIATNMLAGQLVWEKFGKKVAIDLFPQSGELLAEFTCGPAKTRVKGSVMASLPVDEMEQMVEQKFEAKTGKQKPEYYYTSKTVKVKDVLYSAIGGAGAEFEQAGQTVTNVQEDEEALEVNTIV